MSIPDSALLELAGRYLDRQGWFVQITAGESGQLELASVEELSSDQPGLLRLVLEKGGRRVQLFVGSRRASSFAGNLRNEDTSILGALTIDGASTVLYDALFDDECCRQLLSVATDGAEEALRVRHVASLVSHASLVFDERLFMKCYRVLEVGERTEAEMLFGLDSVGFNAIIAPVARWREGEVDLALVREFLPSALEGRLLALTSLRDLLAYVAESEDSRGLDRSVEKLEASEIAASAGGDIAGEITRLGQRTAQLHLALAAAFADEPFDRGALAALDEAIHAEEGTEALRQALHTPHAGTADESLLGKSIRLHGDYHLRRVMRSDAGWLVSGFGDDPLYASIAPRASLSARSGSPLEDVADMFFSIGDVARQALALRPSAEQRLVAPLAEAWAERNRSAFLRGDLEVDGIGALVPTDPNLRSALLLGYELVRVKRYEAILALR